MDYLEFMFAGFAVFWAGLFVYLLMLQMRIRALNREVERLEERLTEQEAEPAPRAPVARPPEPRGAGRAAPSSPASRP